MPGGRQTRRELAGGAWWDPPASTASITGWVKSNLPVVRPPGLQRQLRLRCQGHRRDHPAPCDADAFRYGRRAAFFHGVIGRNLEQRRRWFRPLNIGQLADGLTHSRIAALGQHCFLQIGGIPLLDRDHDWLLVADFARGNRPSGARALGAHTVDHLRPQ